MPLLNHIITFGMLAVALYHTGYVANCYNISSDGTISKMASACPDVIFFANFCQIRHPSLLKPAIRASKAIGSVLMLNESDYNLISGDTKSLVEAGLLGLVGSIWFVIATFFSEIRAGGFKTAILSLFLVLIGARLLVPAETDNNLLNYGGLIGYLSPLRN